MVNGRQLRNGVLVMDGPVRPPPRLRQRGRLICDEVVEPSRMDAAVEGVIDNFLNSGVVGAAANRRAFRIGQEPLDLFRRYVAFYCKAQAQCHFSPQLIDNLERFWQAAEREG